MAAKPRVAKVLAALLVSMTAAAILLMVLSGEPPSAGPFCLSSYYRLDSVEKSTSSRSGQSTNRWSSIEIYYSGTRAGNIEQLASLNGLSSSADLNCHFVICNGLGGEDGQILASEKWQQQWSVVPNSKWFGSAQTIRICVICDVAASRPSDSQIRRTEALVEYLARKFQISAQSIFYPTNWR